MKFIISIIFFNLSYVIMKKVISQGGRKEKLTIIKFNLR